MEIDGTHIGSGQSPYFIAEAGVNHNGDVELAKKLIEVAADAGADAVKFQTFSADRLVSDQAEAAEYQQEQAGFESQKAMLEQYELDKSEHYELIEYANSHNITFLSTPFDKDSADMLRELGVPAIKIGSGDLTNHPLLKHVATYDVPLIVSTGMSTMDEIKEAYDAIQSVDPDPDIIFLHCTSSYPCELNDVNLRAMKTMKEELPTPIGYSDHTTLIETPAFATIAGAQIIEKHFTLSSSLPGPDHAASLEPDELNAAVELTRDAHKILGHPEKRPVDSELESQTKSRKSIHAAKDLSAGTTLTQDSVTITRPNHGIPPYALDDVIDQKLVVDVDQDQPITYETLDN
ncbi:N-acetylneuraminate synthase [Salinarchaeum sp. IM2453]|uniref:N-acetylneuraminate synthase n=1 Tax=Salinarchaeum sp. IM2453 TaxID=2862870 RepID=UPI001C83E057|nr:N-acetylneuraminate synthase [Salinarchaeum sp. IM2453]QZA89091.1 N-acetylneuraminate synthase [Salinarchaeum sp. IM2453]